MVQDKKKKQKKTPAISLQPLTETTISPKIIEKRSKREREQERGSKRLEIVVFCLFMGETYSQELPQSCMIFKIQ